MDLDMLGHLNFVEFCRESTRWGIGGGLSEHDGVLVYATGTWLPYLSNGALRLDPEVDPSAVLAQAEEFFGPGGRFAGRGYSVRVRDVQSDDDLREACEAAGLRRFSDRLGPEMICPRRPQDRPLPSGVEIRVVGTVEEVGDFAAVNAAAYATYGMPPEGVPETFSRPERLLSAPHVRSFVAYDGPRPVAAAQTLASHGVAGVYWVGTVPEARGRGLGDAVARVATNAGFDLGAVANSLQASPMGEEIYRRMGYETRYHYIDFVRWGAPA